MSSNVVSLFEHRRAQEPVAKLPDAPKLNSTCFLSRKERAAQRKMELEELRAARAADRKRASMHTYVFRSYDMIVESDEAELVRDVSTDLHKAKVKLKKVRQRLQSVREQAAAK